jgi:hypothetical protein
LWQQKEPDGKDFFRAESASKSIAASQIVKLIHYSGLILLFILSIDLGKGPTKNTTAQLQRPLLPLSFSWWQSAPLAFSMD